jgi:hypothetical protein
MTSRRSGARPLLFEDPLSLAAIPAIVGCVAVGGLVLRRALFPFDLYIWSESPFMTDMLKLRYGIPIFGPPEDANSFVYAPGLSLICEAVLRPFGADLDVRACRVVSILLGIVAATFAARASIALAAVRHRPVRTVVLALLAWMIVSRNFTADVLHPDNLHLVHATACLSLALAVVEKRSPRVAVLAATVAGAGILTKQTEAASLAGVLAIAAWTFGLRSKTFVASAAAGLASSFAAGGWLFSNPWARFQLLTVLGRHPVLWDRLGELPDRYSSGYRPWIAAIGLAGVITLWRADRRRALAVWAVLGVTCALPNVLAYIKVMGAFNNLGVIDLWLSMPGLAAVAAVTKPTLGRRLAAAAVAALVVWQTWPLKRVLPPEFAAHFSAVEAKIRTDIAAGERVLVGHGTAWWVRAGGAGVPLDRENSILELATAGLADRTNTARRLSDGHYSRVYLLSTWYTPPIRDALAARCDKSETLELADALQYANYHYGSQGFGTVEVWTCRT